MDYKERLSKLEDIRDLIGNFFQQNEITSISANYFTGNCFVNQYQGIMFSCKREFKEDFENLLGYLDVPAMLNGLIVDTANDGVSSTMLHGFVYDDDKFHFSNIKNMNLYKEKDIFSKDKK